MSGRLIILPKKTYCPWNPANVERVLRDERLERERVEKEQRLLQEDERDKKSKRRRQDGEPVPSDEPQRHVNLFPEAEQAELKLVRGKSHGENNASGGDAAEKGVLPVPLGGEEAKNRKSGKVPFYMRPQQNLDSEKHDDIDHDLLLKTSNDHRVRNGIRTGGGVADAITSRIMADQYHSRENSRKQRMDPMSRFMHSEVTLANENDRQQKNTSSYHHDPRTQQFHQREQPTTDDVDVAVAKSMHNREFRHSKKRRSRSRERHHSRSKRSKKNRRYGDGSYYDSDSNVDSSSVSSCSSSSFSSSSMSRGDDSHSRGKYRHRKSKRDKSERKKEKKSHTRKKSHRKNRRDDHERRHRRECGNKRNTKEQQGEAHHHGSGDGEAARSSNDDNMKRQAELEELRRRRHTREAREMEREMQVMKR